MSLIESAFGFPGFPVTTAGGSWFPELNMGATSLARSMLTDIVETPTEVVFKVDLPGYKKSDVHINLDEEKRLLSIRGERSYEKEFENEYRRVSERSFGSFSRSFQLPDICNVAIGPKATMDNGVLRVSVAKTEGKSTLVAPGKRIEIA